ncbi:PEX14 [Sanghuangporus weigelae]
MASSERAELLRNALAFLTDPKTQGSSLTQRIQFLEAKGLTPSEIEEVMKQASFKQNAAVQATPYYSPYQYESPYPAFGSVPPPQQPLDWRDYFIMAVVSGSFMFGAVSLARKYLMPHLRPPTSTAYEEDRDALTEQFDAAEKLLKEIQAETAAVRQAVEEQKVKVDQTTQEVDACVKEMREGETRTRDEMREIREEINSIREMLPKMIDKNKESQSQSLGELQQELKSLKALLMSRGPTYPTTPSPSLPSFVGRPSIPAWQLAGNSSSEPPAPSSSTSPSQVNGQPKISDVGSEEINSGETV